MEWKPIESAPKDGATVEVRGVMFAHRMPGAKFPIMPKDWRPDTPQTEWHITGWREVAPISSQASTMPLPSPPRADEGEKD